MVFQPISRVMIRVFSLLIAVLTSNALALVCEKSPNQNKNSSIEDVVNFLAAKKSGCQLVTPKIECKDCLSFSGLSPFWAQEYMGADLAKEVVLKGKYTVPVVSVWDDNFEDVKQGPFQKKSHGARVRGVLSDDGQQAGAPKTRLLQYESKPNKDANKWVEDLIAKSNGRADWPKVLNFSAAVSPSIDRAIKGLASHGTISTIAAGNDFPSPVLDGNPATPGPDRSKILVGSLSPQGLVSGFSNNSTHVTISAPSDFYLVSGVKSQNGQTEYTGFSGTSGAAPLVASAILNVASILPDITFDEVRQLIGKTAISTLNSFERPRTNGAGMINAFKMVKVAEKVRNLCAKSADFSSCRHSAIFKDTTYSFGRDAKLNNKVISDFPTCAKTQSQVVSSINCESRKATFQAIRQEAFLNPKDSGAWATLACIHRTEGFETNAEHYQLLAELAEHNNPKRVGDNLWSLLEKLDRMPKAEAEFHRLSVYRSLPVTGSPGIDYLKKKAIEGHPSERMCALKALLGTKEAYWAVQQAFKDSDPEIDKVAITLAVNVGSSTLPLFEKYLNSTDSNVRETAYATIAYFGEAALPVLEQGTKDNTMLVRYQIAKTAEIIGPKAKRILEILMTDSDEAVKKKRMTPIFVWVCLRTNSSLT